MAESLLSQVNATLREGRFAEAAALAERAILGGGLEARELAELSNALGTARAQAGDVEAAERAYLASVAADGSLYKPHANLANLYAKRSQIDAAVACLEEAVRLAPDAARLWARLGQLLAERGALPAAAAAMTRAVELEESTPHRIVLARILLGLDRPVSVLSVLEGRDLAADPGGIAIFIEALAKARDPRLGEALASAAASPMPAETAQRLAELALQAGLFDRALQLARSARSQASPQNDGPVLLEAAALEASGDPLQAIELLQRAFDASPSIARVTTLAEIALRSGARARSPGTFEAARVLFRDSPDVLVAWGGYARAQGDFDAAHAAFEQAHQLAPDHPAALLGLGVAEATIAPGPRAIELLERAVRAAPEDPSPYSALLFAELHAGVWSNEERLERHRQFGRRFGHVGRRSPSILTDRSDRALRVGYLSADFRDHAVAKFLEGVLAAHDRAAIEVFLYGSVARPDAVTERFRALGTYRDISRLQLRQAADRIAADSLDVLVSIDGHTAASRVRVLAARPAPVQVSFLGYPASLGLDCIDARITDAIADPDGADALYTERLFRLPQTAWCFTPGAAPEPTREPTDAAVVFSSFNRSAKVSDAFLECVRRILQAVPTSRFAIKCPTAGSRLFRARVGAALREAASRVDFLPWAPDTSTHLAAYRRVDIALDTFPYAGTTTTAEALFMGVPVVTLAGKAHVERVGASMLDAVGLGDLVATSEDEYVDRAVRIAQDDARRRSLRGGLRQLMKSTPLGDPVRFARSLEACLREIVETVSRRPPPAGTRIVETDLGVRIVVPDSLDTITTFVIPEQKRWFEDEVPFVRKLLEPGETVVDVGANLGVYTLEAAKLVGPSGKVIAFEPSSSTAGMLRASVSENALTNVTVHQVALGGREGEANLLIAASPELSQLGSGQGPSEVVPIKTLRGFERDVAGVRFLKLDAEGSEKDILEAAGDIVAREGPVVMFELRHANRINTDLIGVFPRLGFDVYRLCPGPCLLVPAPELESLDTFCLNLFAVRPDRAAELEARGMLARRAGDASPASDAEVAAWAASRPLLHALGLHRRVGDTRGLRHWLRSRNVELSPPERYAALLAAEAEATAALQQSGTPAAHLTLVRVLLELGERARAVALTRELLRGGPYEVPDRAFACPLEGYDEQVAFAPERLYIAQGLEVLITRGAFSSFYQRAGILESFRAFYAAGGESAAVDERLGLLLARAESRAWG
ncbi:MAG: FkbM family methyltransferase [Polyangiaceae bacterium]|nr:FkbM family methyltransferase [Polyangiaceae bacterium]